MRGKIIHYNGTDGSGLVAADGRQIPFHISNWRSDTAPAVNQVVDVSLAGNVLDSLARVAEDVLLKEKASQFASQLGSAGGAALQSLRDATPAGSTGNHGLQRLGKPLLVAHGAFALSALALPYVSIDSPFGGGASFTLAGLSRLSEQMGASVGGAFWPWLAILSVAIPVFWKHRLAWLALLLPLVATVKPATDIASGAREAARGADAMFGPGVASRVMEQITGMLEPGIGAWACLLSALFLAGVGVKRVLLPPSA